MEQGAAGNLVQKNFGQALADIAFGYRLPLSPFLPKREPRTDCVQVVTLCDGTTVYLSQNKHAGLFGYSWEENQSASLTHAAFSCSSRFGTQKVQYAKA
jgi:hypothetical protein